MAITVDRLGSAYIKSINVESDYYNNAVRARVELEYYGRDMESVDREIKELHHALNGRQAYQQHPASAIQTGYSTNTWNNTNPPPYYTSVPTPDNPQQVDADFADPLEVAIEALRTEMRERFDAIEEMLRLLVDG
jgi:hypothetical protein